MSKSVRPNLFTPAELGPITLSHRIVMPPMTRMRSNKDDTVTDLMVEYYGQRASEGGLIILEGAFVSANGNGYYGAPGIHSDKFIPGFKRIADAIHAKGGYVYAQLWHAGRVSHVSLQPGGRSPVAPSFIESFQGHAASSEGVVVASPARALTIEKIAEIVEDFRLAAARAKAAGLDGVELHGANGYLPDQFLQDNSNKRTDSYGGSIENRARFFLEVTKAMISVWGPGRVGVRISPSGSFNEMADSNPAATFGYLAEKLNELDLAYLHIVEPRIVGDVTKEDEESSQDVASRELRKFYKGTIIAAGGFTQKSAEDMLANGNADLVAFGRNFLSNPDLPRRMKRGLWLNPHDRSTFYGGDSRGFTDYPFYEDVPATAELATQK
jgi:N-ethylmaleimide reductase